MNKFDKILSYLYPKNICTTSSELNSLLEVVYQDGRYQLNSVTTNYSYGGLYELFKLIFRDVKIDWVKVNEVLILGFGTGCTVPLIRSYSTDCHIVGVEIDEKVIELGKTYFDTEKLTNTVVVCDSAVNFIASTNQKFDLVIIDVYVDNVVPKEVETFTFLQNLKTTLNQDGMVIFNKLICSREVKHQIPALEHLYRTIFDIVELRTIMQTGAIFVARNKNR